MCTDPPDPSCIDPFTVSIPAASGACVGDRCQYDVELGECEFGCDTAECVCVHGEICLDSTPQTAVTWASVGGVPQPRVASLGCSQVVAAPVSIGGVYMPHVWIIDHQGAVLHELGIDSSATRVDVAADRGVIAVTWSGVDDQVFGSLFDLQLAPIATNVPLSDPARQLRSPSIAPTSDGDGFVAVYYGEGAVAGTFGVFSQKLDRSGSLVGAENDVGPASGQLSSGCYTFPDVATGDGGSMAVWAHCESGTRSAYAAPLDAAGAATAMPTLIDEASMGSITPYRAAVVGIGSEFAVTYTNDRDPMVPNSGNAYVAVLDAAATLVVDPVDATAGTWGEGKFWPDLVAGPNGLVLTWYSIDLVSDRRILFSAIDPATAMPAGPLLDASLPTGAPPFFHMYGAPFVGPQEYGVIFAGDGELLLVSRACPPA
ncbi:hypothetical protein [Paraliomyxa miuraensis]|uniref:hypothetical protein n=1 Tax=Paraliomyxa miuraensis TaxID=376150 RepID=UPI00224EB518|nr:hypothetical protein [Paraliomyxa miuraensis]MCX4247796.1 hypothetical protein [Paraliomyxa miuraensis]